VTELPLVEVDFDGAGEADAEVEAAGCGSVFTDSLPALESCAIFADVEGSGVAEASATGAVVSAGAANTLLDAVAVVPS
jgi:hypothetical protein